MSDDCNCFENEKHYVGEIGTLFYIDCGMDVSLANKSEVFLSRPDGSTIRKTANLTTFRGSTDFVYFLIEDGDFNQPGKYTGQVFIAIGAWSGWGKPFRIDVDTPISSSSSSSSTS